MIKKNILITLILLFSLIIKADDSKTLKETEEEIRKAKVELLKWDKTHAESDLLAAIEILKNARTNILNVKETEDPRFLEVNKELTMLYFWANKSKRVGDVTKEKKEIDQFKKSVEDVQKEQKNNVSTVKANNQVAIKENLSLLEKIMSTSIPLDQIEIPIEHEIITTAFQKAIEFSKNNANQLYECEYMFRDIFYDFPTSKTAILSNEIANKYSAKIESIANEKFKFRSEVTSKIPNYEGLYNSKNFDPVIAAIVEMKKTEKNPQKQDIYWEMLEEYRYLQTAVLATNDLLLLKKNDPPPASIVGVKFRGFITGSDSKGVTITTDMGSMSIPWTKVSDEQFGKLLAVISKGIEVSYKIPIAIHLLGDTEDAFQILYQRSLDNPLILAKYSRFYFQTLFYFRKEMALKIDLQIENAQKLFNNKDTTGAIGVLTQSLLTINKNNFLRDQIGKIHEAIATFNK